MTDTFLNLPDARRELAIQSRDFFFQYLAGSK